MLCCDRYTHLLRLIESTRDYEEQEQVDKADGYKAVLLSNLALATFHLEEYARSIEWCDKALQVDPGNAKVCRVCMCGGLLLFLLLLLLLPAAVARCGALCTRRLSRTASGWRKLSCHKHCC